MNNRHTIVIGSNYPRHLSASLGSGIFGMMLAVTAICVVLCLSVSVSDDVVLHGSEEPPLFLPQSTPESQRDQAKHEGRRYD